MAGEQFQLAALSPDDVNEVLQNQASKLRVEAAPDGSIVEAPPASAPGRPPFDVPEPFAQASLAAALPLTKAAPPLNVSDPVAGEFLEAGFAESKAALAAAPTSGTPPAPGTGTAPPGAPPVQPDGFQTGVESLRRLRGSGLTDPTIRQGIGQGMLPSDVEIALGQEEQSIRNLAGSREEALKEQQFAQEAADEEAVRQQAFQDADRLKLQTALEGHVKIQADMVEKLRDFKINDPWASKSTGQKILAAISMAMGAFGSAVTGSPNFALNIIQESIESDIKLQTEERRGKRGALSEQRGLVASLRNQLGDQGQAQAVARQEYWNRVERQMNTLKMGQDSEEMKLKLDTMLVGVAEEKEAARVQAEEAAWIRTQREYMKTTQDALEQAQGSQEMAGVMVASGDPALARVGVQLLAKEGKDNKPLTFFAKLNDDVVNNRMTPEERVQAISAKMSGRAPSVNGIVAMLLQKHQAGETLSDRDLDVLDIGMKALSPEDKMMVGMGFGSVRDILKGRSTDDDREPITPELLKAVHAENLDRLNQTAQAGAGAIQQPTSDLPRVATAEDYARLASGAEYLDPDGNKRRKP